MKKQACQEIKDYICPPGKRLTATMLGCPVIFALAFLLLWRVGKPPRLPLSIGESLIGAAVLTAMAAAILLRPWIAATLALRRIKLAPEALLSDFRESEALFDGRMRIGSQLVYVAGEGELIPSESVERFKSQVETRTGNTFVVAVTAGGIEKRCMDYSRAQLEQMDLEDGIRQANDALRRNRG